MAGTRSSARQADKNNSSPPSSEKKSGTKRKAGDDASPESTKAKSDRPEKGQKTLEETIAPTEEEELPKDEGFDEEMEEKPEATNGEVEAETKTNGEQSNGDGQAETNGNGEKNALDQVKADENEAGTTSKEEEDDKDAAAGAAEGSAVEEDKQREKAQPSNVLEKGIIYFFTRGRVGIEDPSNVTDLQRSFFVLRPLPVGAKLTDGAIQDVGNNRLVALPKKVWPKSGRDRFMCFVEKSKTSMDTLKETFFQGSDYSTKTTGTRHTPEVSPLGEGVYAITSTGSGRPTTHLAYMLTIPRELGDVQKDVGIAEKGSFVLSIKNPEASSGNANAIPATPDYPKEMLDEFAGRGWLPAEPQHLDYEGTACLLIGESFESGSALEPTEQDKKSDAKEEPKEELEKLEGEDEERIENLKGDDSIFEDLGISSKEYSMMTTW